MSEIERIPLLSNPQPSKQMVNHLTGFNENKYCDGCQRIDHYCLTQCVNFRDSPALKRTYVIESGQRSCKQSAPPQQRANEHRPQIQQLKITRGKIAHLQNTIMWNQIWSFTGTITNFRQTSVLERFKDGCNDTQHLTLMLSFTTRGKNNPTR